MIRGFLTPPWRPATNCNFQEFVNNSTATIPFLKDVQYFYGEFTVPRTIKQIDLSSPYCPSLSWRWCVIVEVDHFLSSVGRFMSWIPLLNHSHNILKIKIFIIRGSTNGTNGLFHCLNSLLQHSVSPELWLFIYLLLMTNNNVMKSKVYLKILNKCNG